MRVIAGTARRLQLKTPLGLQVRPTTDRTKETLFNMINPYLYDAFFLDLFSGSGAIGIEALSRGAKKAVFVERDLEAISCIKYNLTHTKLQDKGFLFTQDVLGAIKELVNQNEVFDIIFMDPPYNQGLEHRVLEELSHSNLLNDETLIIVEAHLDTTFEYLDSLGLEVEKVKRYKTNQHIFIRKML